MRDLPVSGELSDPLTTLIGGGGYMTFEQKKSQTEHIASQIINTLTAGSLVSGTVRSLEECAYEVNSRIVDPNLRNDSIFRGMIRES